MADRTYYVLCADNCKFEGMSKEQILTAITQAVENHEIADINSGFITTIKEMNKDVGLKFWVGTQAEYNKITPEDNVFYIISDDTSLEDISTEINSIKASLTSLIESLQIYKQTLYEGKIHKGLLASGETKYYLEIPELSKYNVIEIVDTTTVEVTEGIYEDKEIRYTLTRNGSKFECNLITPTNGGAVIHNISLDTTGDTLIFSFEEGFYNSQKTNDFSVVNLTCDLTYKDLAVVRIIGVA